MTGPSDIMGAHIYLSGDERQTIMNAVCIRDDRGDEDAIAAHQSAAVAHGQAVPFALGRVVGRV